MVIKSIKGEKLGQTSYILEDEKQAVIIDCGFDFATVDDYVKSNKLNVLGVFLTHGHFDHALAGAQMLANGYEIYSSAYSDKLTSGGWDLGRFLGVKFTKFNTQNKLEDNQTIKLGNFEITALYTPGHTVDGMCYLANGILFSGDTLLSGAYGRVDLPTASVESMKVSLKKLLSFDKKMIVCSGHENAHKGINLYFPNRTIGDYCCSQDIVYFLQN